MNNLLIIKVQILVKQDIRDKTLLMQESNELAYEPCESKLGIGIRFVSCTADGARISQGGPDYIIVERMSGGKQLGVICRLS
jgi:hypothetical protein